MKKIVLFLLAVVLLLSGCSAPREQAPIAATTLPVYEFTVRLCQGTGLSVTRLVTESVSCLHDYSLSVRQVQAAEAAELLVISGAGLEEFMADLIGSASAVADASQGLELLESHEDHAEDAHDPHIWLSPAQAMGMVQNICRALQGQYPQFSEIFEENARELLEELAELERYGRETLSDLKCRELITFHDGFSYLAQAFDLEILEAIEEESGSEASAMELKKLIGLVQEHQLPAIFVERSGSSSAAEIIARETGVQIYTLDMGLSSGGYFESMYYNINTIKEALS